MKQSRNVVPKENKTVQKIGSWSFLIGMLISVVAGFMTGGNWYPVMVGVLVILGLIVGFLNVTGRETTPFLLSAVVLVIVADFGGRALSVVSPVLQQIFNAIVVFVVPSTIVVALKAIYALASDE